MKILGLLVATGVDIEHEMTIANGSSVILNFSSSLHTVRFGVLADKSFFRRDVTVGECIRRDNKIEISVSEVFQLAPK